jgi:tetratricopeptide (TPR) repeat protein
VTSRLHAAALLTAALVCAPARLHAAPEPASTSNEAVEALLAQAEDAIVELRLDEAEGTLAAIARTHPGLPALIFAQAELHFYRGEYTNAVTLADRALADAHGRKRGEWQSMRDLMADTASVTRDFDHKVSDDGRYSVAWPKGKDAVLADYALQVLASADRALKRIFGHSLPSPIRLEVYDSPETLAKVSSLTEAQIKTTGTVALSKWDRLMITSPKALVRGYPWADTITHELVHMVVSRVTGDRAPVWLQEGTAKLFERSWRSHGADLVLEPAAQALLYEASAKGKLLTFDQMHPSIAMLPSEDDAALAFAEVATFMHLYTTRHGEATLRDALGRIGHGIDARDALAQAAKRSFSALEKSWRDSLPTAADTKTLRRLRTRFNVGDAPADESSDVVIDGARRHMRIGDLLWDRGRKGAAAIEYEMAQKADRDDPIVAARWARAALDANNPAAVIEALQPQIARYPGLAASHALLGAARLQLGERVLACDSLREAIWVNPFDPSPHCNLAAASDDSLEIERERRACEALR